MNFSKSLAGLLALSAFAMLPKTARADLLVSPSGGTTVFDNTVSHDDSVQSVSLPMSFNFFNTPVNSLIVSANGFVGTGDVGFSNTAFPATGPGVIAPFWDDLFLYTGVPGALVSTSAVGNSFSFTWQNIGFFSGDASGSVNTFQATLFTGVMTIGGFTFQSGDIAFSYASLGAAFSATIGVNSGDGSQGGGGGIPNALGDGGFAVLPGTTDGQISDPSLVPFGSQFVYLQANGEGYIASIQSISAVPEPQTWIAGLGALATVGFGFQQRRRRAVTVG